MIYSFSRLQLYSRCPYRFYRKYLLGEQDQVTLPLALGKAVHKAVESRIEGKDMNSAIASGILEVDFFPGVTYADIEYMVRNSEIKPGIGKTEVYFKEALSEEENAPVIQGFIDLVENDGMAITDWKTNRKVYNVLDTYQVGLYAWAISKIYNNPQVYGSLYFLRFKKSSRYLFGYEEMEAARKWAYDTAKEIETSLAVIDMIPEEATTVFPCRPSSDCSHCPFALECSRDFAIAGF